MGTYDTEAVIAEKYTSGVYSVEDVFKLTTIGQITKEQFHWITGYDYNGLKRGKKRYYF